MAELPQPLRSDHAFDLELDELVSLLQNGELNVIGRMPYSSNVTLLVELRHGNVSHPAIYKGVKGERPLADFPAGLYKREVAFYTLAKAIGWNVVPPTAVTSGGPLGPGSVQAFVNANFEHHYFSLLSENKGIADLRKICLIDIVANNTDRKSGHCLFAADGTVYGIDNGLSFHCDWKLRTVIWDFALARLDKNERDSIAEFVEARPESLFSELLEPEEIKLMFDRSETLATEGRFPADDTGGYRYPMPLI